MLVSGILQCPTDLVVPPVSQATVIVNSNSYPIYAYAEPKSNGIDFREYLLVT